jgi:hypothetical protein
LVVLLQRAPMAVSGLSGRRIAQWGPIGRYLAI